MLSLLDDAADDIAAVETEKHERALHQEAVALVQRFLPNFNSSPELFGSFLVFTPGQVIALLEAIDEFGLDDSQDEGPWTKSICGGSRALSSWTTSHATTSA